MRMVDFHLPTSVVLGMPLIALGLIAITESFAKTNIIGIAPPFFQGLTGGFVTFSLGALFMSKGTTAAARYAKGLFLGIFG